MPAACPPAAWLWGPKRKSSAYLSHQLGEVRGVPGRQPQQRPSAGVQRRAVGHDQDDACCGRRNSSRSAQGRSAAFIRPRVPKVAGTKLPHGAPNPTVPGRWKQLWLAAHHSQSCLPLRVLLLSPRRPQVRGAPGRRLRGGTLQRSELPVIIQDKVVAAAQL